MLYVLFGLIFFTMSGFAAEHSRPYKDKKDAEISAGIESLDIDAIHEAGQRKLLSKKARLQEIAGSADIPKELLNNYEKHHVQLNMQMKNNLAANYTMARHAARVALAQMGDKKILKEYVDQLSSKDDREKAAAISALAGIGDRRAVKYLIPLLDDASSPKIGSRSDSSFRERAEQALERILPEVAAEFRKSNPKKRFYFFDEWKVWWNDNAGKFKEGLE